MEEISLRRICLKNKDENGKEQVFTIAPSGVMPYFVGLTDEIEKALFLRRFDVPFWALSHVFGRNDQYWHRLENHFGRYNLVQTVVKDPEKLPQHLLADEKITRLNGEEVVVATTVGNDCVLGASVALGADTAQLTEAYQRFKDEALQLNPDYKPETALKAYRRLECHPENLAKLVSEHYSDRVHFTCFLCYRTSRKA